MATEIKEVGKRVRLVNSSRLNVPAKPGEAGLIWRVSQFGTRRGLWDNGGQSDLNAETDDLEVLDDEDSGEAPLFSTRDERR